MYVFPEFGKRKVGSLKKSDVRRFYNGLVDSQRLKVATVENIHTVLHQVLDFADIRDKRDYNIGDVLKHALPQDFVKFGLIPEFIGRVPVTVSLDMLDRDALIRILQEPKNALTKQYQKLFELDGVALDFDKEALEAIADKALERKTGARGLRAIMEAVTLDLMYHIPSDESITQCQITKEMVDEQLAIEERELEKIEEKQVG